MLVIAKELLINEQIKVKEARVLDENGQEIELKDEDEDEDLIYTTDERMTTVSTNEEVLDSGFVIDEDSPEGIMDMFGSDEDADDYED